MGTFQAIASGLGETGESLGQGQNQALTEALKVRAQAHLEDMDTAHLALAKAGQEQAYNIAQQQHDLFRQQLLQNNQEDLGLAFDSSTGGYVRNMRDKTTNKITGYPLGPGVYPPDSPEMQMANYKRLLNMTKDGTPDGEKVFTSTAARNKAFAITARYGLSPVDQLQGFREDGEDLKDRGVTTLHIPGFGTVDFRKPGAVEQYAQWENQAQHPQGLGSLLRAETGLKQVDTTGWTANEQRQYRAAENREKYKEQQAMEMEKINMLDPSSWGPEAAKARHDRLTAASDEMYKNLETLEDEINRVHGRGTKPAPGQRWSKSAWAAANPGMDANAAEAYARARGVVVLP